MRKRSLLYLSSSTAYTRAWGIARYTWTHGSIVGGRDHEGTWLWNISPLVKQDIRPRFVKQLTLTSFETSISEDPSS
jgi:hypothetical protein